MPPGEWTVLLVADSHADRAVGDMKRYVVAVGADWS